MPRRYSVREAEAARNRIGIQLIRQKGSHIRYRGIWRGMERNVTLVAGQNVIQPRTLSEVLKQAGLSADELARLVAGEDVAE